MKTKTFSDRGKHRGFVAKRLKMSKEAAQTEMRHAREDLKCSRQRNVLELQI